MIAGAFPASIDDAETNEILRSLLELGEWNFRARSRPRLPPSRGPGPLMRGAEGRARGSQGDCRGSCGKEGDILPRWDP